jgi:alanyl aminopeptidase
MITGCAAAPVEPPLTARPVASVSAPSLGIVPEIPAIAPPLGRLPTEVQPSEYALELTIDPKQDRYSGVVDIAVDIAHPRQVVFMHGKKLHVTKVTLTPEGGAPIEGSYREVHTSGVVAIELAKPAPAGHAKLHLEWDAAFMRNLRGLYRVDRLGSAYAFTQFEAISAREAFPCFDEPAFKTPYDVTLVVPEGSVAIANTKESKKTGNRVTFARTQPLPSYLLAWAVGPLDVVDAGAIPPNGVRKTPLPFRAIAAKGRGKDLAYAVANTARILATLESYFNIPYPYDKLDVIAVPDRDGAMENAGAITFAEFLLLIDEKTATLQQKRAYAGVMAHELAHQWFGDLVTMPWWDDIWLNEAFATWMGTRATQLWKPENNAELFLLDRIHDAMGVDALTHARAIRQPIESDHDITNAFDAITYQKGAAVLAMFERYIGRDTFQKGIRAYLEAHRHGLATADDLLSALSTAAGKDVAAPFKTFLDRPGVPFVEVRLDCNKVSITQSRYFSIGSKGDTKQVWQVPVCVRYPAGAALKETCKLATSEKSELALETKQCAPWVMPNADAAAYFRFGMPKEQLSALLTQAWPKLVTRERLAVADAVRAGFARGTSRAGDVFDDLAPMANDSFPSVAAAPMGMAQTAREWLFGTELRPKVEAWASKLYAKNGAALGWNPPKGEAPERTILRSSVLSFLAFTARDPAVRKEAGARGRAFVGFGKDQKLHPEAVDSNLAGIALSVAADEGDAAFFDALLVQLEHSDDPVIRGRLLGALGSVTTPELAKRARALTTDPRLRANEVLIPLSVQLQMIETRDASWVYMRDAFDAIVTRLSPGRAGGLPYFVRYCDDAHINEVEAFFTPKIAALDGGPRNLANALESMRLCSARRKAHEENMRAYFASKP